MDGSPGRSCGIPKIETQCAIWTILVHFGDSGSGFGAFILNFCVKIVSHQGYSSLQSSLNRPL